MFFSRSGVSPLLVVFIGIVVLFACETQEAPSSYVARVGDHYLRQDELDRRLQGMSSLPDSSQARQQIIEQWVTRTLLLREAERLNLEDTPAVQRRLQERRRSTLVTAMSNRIYNSAELSPTDDEIQSYFDKHKRQLRLREPYVRVRYLTTSRADSAQAARAALRSLPAAAADSAWRALQRQYSTDSARVRSISDQFFPTGRLTTLLPYSSDVLSDLQPGDVSPIAEARGRYHVIQLVQRAPEGAEPKLAWVREEIRRRLRVRNRKQMYAREVQRLRNRARADNTLETPESP